jgi:squalene-hopene/tetraprenyl-beta-curcumene cyclase
MTVAEQRREPLVQSLRSTAASQPTADRSLEGRIASAVGQAQASLLALQKEDGHWRGELEGDTILESEYLMTLHFLGRTGGEKFRKAANYLREQQMEEGGWAHFPGGDADVSTTVKAYFALKLAGDAADAPHMERALAVAQDLGGVRACNSYTKLYLAIFGQYPWERCPAVPPEMILLPKWLPFNVYAMSAWSRAIVVPMAIIWSHRPHCPVPEGAEIPELDVPGSRRHRAKASTLGGRAWPTLFEAIDLGLRWIDRAGLTPQRKRGVERCEAWMLERLDRSAGLGAIFPPILNAIMAMRCLDYPLDHPALVGQIDELEKLEIEEGDTLRLQPCESPVWDTGQALYALLESGLEPDDPAVIEAAEWLLTHEVDQPGDWQIRNPKIPVGGWYFEYANQFYPDCDDTAEVLTALASVRHPNAEVAETTNRALERGVAWMLGMQNRDGGWASFDRGCDFGPLAYIPFADHNAIIDPSTIDITSRAIEALRSCGLETTHPAIEQAVAFVLREQEADGKWYGRWGANYIYGTWLALVGLERGGFDMMQPPVRRAVDWLIAHQNADGGWGESLRSYDDPSWAGKGESTAAQTAWALLGLCAADEAESPEASLAIDYLLETQTEDGTWYDAPWTGTGFPGVFYLRYHYYAVYFPLLALAVAGRQMRAQ